MAHREATINQYKTHMQICKNAGMIMRILLDLTHIWPFFYLNSKSGVGRAEGRENWSEDQASLKPTSLKIIRNVKRYCYVYFKIT